MIRRLTTSLLTIAGLASVVGYAQSLPPLTRHVRDVTTNGEAQFVGHLPATQSMRLVLVLPLRNQAGLEEFLSQVYNPSSSSFRHFLTVEEFTSRFGPTQQDYDTLRQFAVANGFTVVGTSRNRLNLDVTGTVANVEHAFHLTMGLYLDPVEKRNFFAPDREPTPDLAVQLWHVSGLDNYSVPKPAIEVRPAGVKPNATTGSCPSASFCGSDMRAAYYGGSLTGAGQSVGLLEYFGTDLADVTTYYRNAGQTNNVTITLTSVDGTSTSCRAPGCDDTEQTLDITQALGMAPGLSSLVVYVGNSNPLDDSGIFNAMATAKPLNAQLSSSWTWSPADPSTDNPYFLEFAAQGQNLFQAAGDSGAWKSSSAIWPADSVYLTSVGGTDLTTSSAGGPWHSESAWSNGGGGISPNHFAIPSWQTSAASGCASCSKTYRNAPDVSANANYTFYVCADQTTCSANNYGGTSFAAPMWAGYLALANEQAVANTGSPIGFINPTLYSIGGGANYTTDFHDVTSGSNGFSATTGYDLATGWGSPNGSGLINDLAGSSSTPGFTLSASPSSLSVAPGNSGTTTITSTVTGGFNSVITLSASGQPAGVSISFSPSSITGAGSSSMTLTVGSTTTPGTYTITVSGTSGSTTATTSVTLTVTGGTPDFSISASPTSISVRRGATGTSTITTSVAGGFDAGISLSASGQGTAQHVTFSPSTIAAPGAGTSTMSVKVGPNARLGTHTITIAGTGGGVTHTTTVVLDILN